MSNPSVQSQILAAAVAALNAGGVSAFRCRMTAFSPEQLPAANVLPDEGQAAYTDTDSIDRHIRFKVRYTTQAVDECDAAVDAVYVTGSQALLADPTLGGLAIFTREMEQKWEMEKGALDTVALAVTYESEFSTTRSDPSVRCP